MNQTPFEEGRYYHIFNRGNNKENLFKEDKNYYYFLQKIEKYLLPVADILSYCFLKNHFHLVVRIKELENLPDDYITGKKRIHQPFSNLFNSYSKSINKSYNRTGSLFQEHLHRNLIDSNEYLQDAIIYIHLNPVKHKFSADYRTYNYSSYKALVSQKPTNICRDFVLELFGDLDNFKYCHLEKYYKNYSMLSEIEAIDM